jgi:ABC-type Mn2+/Zn2+ transport system permease subunit
MNSWQDYVSLIQFLAPSLALAAAVSLAGSVTGIFVVLRRESLLALALPQIVALGAAIGLRYGVPPILPAAVVVAAALLILAWARHTHRTETVLPALYVTGLSVSIVLIAKSGKHLAELQNLFTGLDVTVSFEEACIAVPILLGATIVVTLFWRRWLLLGQAPATAQVARVRLWFWHGLFLVILATIVIVGSDGSGIALVISALFLPAALVLPWSRRVPIAMIAAAIFSQLIVAGGFVFSFEANLPFSHSIAAMGCICVFLGTMLRVFVRR